MEATNKQLSVRLTLSFTNHYGVLFTTVNPLPHIVPIRIPPPHTEQLS